MATQDTPAEEPVEAEIVEETIIPREEPPAPPVRSRRSGAGSFIGLLLGGVAAAAIGFGLARYLPNGWPLPDVAALQTRIDAHQSAIADLQQKLANLPAPTVPDLSGDLAALRQEFDARLAGLPAPQDDSAAVAAAQSALAALDMRVATLEKQPSGADGAASSTAVAAFERDLQALRQQIEAQGGAGAALSTDLQAAVDDAKAQLASAAEAARQATSAAEASARAARNDLALGRISAAIEAGGPYAAALDELRGAGLTIPDVLAAGAASGVPTLVDLQRTFPDAAREALSAALRADAGSTWGERVGAFLRTQAGIRSLSPREGDDPDAVLSRAEASLTQGDVGAALAGIATLPQAAQAAMSGWADEAAKRQAAIDGLAALSASLAAQ